MKYHFASTIINFVFFHYKFLPTKMKVLAQVLQRLEETTSLDRAGASSFWIGVTEQALKVLFLVRGYHLAGAVP
jgi:hypothetical protein